MPNKLERQSAGKSEKENDKSEDIRLSTVVKNMTFGEWSALLSIVVVIIGSAATAGGIIERMNRESLISTAVLSATKPMTEELDISEKEKAVLSTDLGAAHKKLLSQESENTRLKQANDAMETEVRTLLENLEFEQSFTTFAENYINYLAGGGPVAANILSDYVCALYRESQTSGKSINFQTTSVRDIVRGNFDLSVDELEASGYNVDLVRELREIKDRGIVRVLPNVSKTLGREVSPSILRQPGANPFFSPTVRKENKARSNSILNSAIRKVDQEVGVLIKVVTFPGHAPFQMPDEIAKRVHQDPSCRIR